MVGLDKFKEAFAEFSENYVIIGGTDCDIVMTGTGGGALRLYFIDRSTGAQEGLALIL